MSTSLNKHSDQIEALSSTFANFKQQIIDLLLDLVNEDAPTRNQSLQVLAVSLDRTPSFMSKVFDGVKLFTSMPDLLTEIRTDSTFDLDRLAAIGAQSRKFDHVHPEEVETLIRDLIHTDETCPSPAKITRTLANASYEKSVRVQPVRKNKQPSSELNFDPEKNVARIEFSCTQPQFSLIKRLIDEYSDENNCSSADSILHLLRGGKRPRTNIMAFDLGDEDLWVEGEGWVSRKEFEDRGNYLSDRQSVSAKEIIESFLHR